MPQKVWKNRVVGAALVAALGQPSASRRIALRRGSKTRFFHTFPGISNAKGFPSPDLSRHLIIAISSDGQTSQHKSFAYAV
jgi:hypothetical protein